MSELINLRCCRRCRLFFDEEMNESTNERKYICELLLFFIRLIYLFVDRFNVNYVLILI